jgi:hypothetical protein
MTFGARSALKYKCKRASAAPESVRSYLVVKHDDALRPLSWKATACPPWRLDGGGCPVIADICVRSIHAGIYRVVSIRAIYRTAE